MSPNPSGEQYEIRAGETRATVVEVGGALRDLRVGDRPLLDGYRADQMCTGARGQSLLPWPNRVRDGKYAWDGVPRQLALTEPDNSCAIHGLVRWVNWECAERSTEAVVMATRLHPQTGWDWTLDLTIGYTVHDTGITVRTTARNPGDAPAPFAAGAHPYLAVGRTPIDSATLTVPAGSYLPTDDQQIPTGREPVAGTPYDFRAPRPIGDVRIDYAYADLDRGSDAVFRARLEGEWTAEIWLDDAYRYFEVFTGDTLPEPRRRRTGLGMEPMTAPPNALASGVDLEVLEPGGSWAGSWGIRLVG